MRAILLSVKNKHICNMHNGQKTNELRTKPPKIECPFKVYNYDTETSGGSGKVVSEWICDSMQTYLIYIGIPQHLIDTGCVTASEIMKYTNNGDKDLTAMHISNLVIYDKPKELSEFYTIKKCNSCKWTGYKSNACIYDENCKRPFAITRPPQSWCYVEELQEERHKK